MNDRQPRRTALPMRMAMRHSTLPGLPAALFALTLCVSVNATPCVELLEVGELVFDLIVESDVAFIAGEVGLSFDGTALRLAGVEPRLDDLIPPGAGALLVDDSPGASCPAGVEVGAGLVIGWHFADPPEDPDPDVNPLDPDRYTIARITFEPAAGFRDGACSPLRFLRCLGPTAAPVRGVLTDETGETVLLDQIDTSACAGDCATLNIPTASRADCDTLEIAVLENGMLVESRTVTGIEGMSGPQLAARIHESFASAAPDLGVGLFDDSVRFCLPAGRLPALEIDGVPLIDNPPTITCGVPFRGGTPACPGTDGDADGDAVCDPDDNCVEAFNPVQDDLDADGIGDACDTCPDAVACPCLRLRVEGQERYGCASIAMVLIDGDGSDIPDSRREVALGGRPLGFDVVTALREAFEREPIEGFDLAPAPAGLELCRRIDRPFGIALEAPAGGERTRLRDDEGRFLCGLRVWLQLPLCPSDRDSDGVCDGVDNCPTVPNPAQIDVNDDGFGDACRASRYFRRGLVNVTDDVVNLSDAVALLNLLFRGGQEVIDCRSAMDIDDSGGVEITDAVVILRWAFAGGAPPAEPFETCGPDATEDGLGCNDFPACEG